MPCNTISLAIACAGAAARIMQVLQSSLALQSCHMLVNGPKGYSEKEKPPLPAGQPPASPTSLFVQKEMREPTATSYSSSRPLGMALKLSHPGQLFKTKGGDRTVEIQRCSYMQLTGGWLSAYILSWVLVSWVYVYLLILPY